MIQLNLTAHSPAELEATSKFLSELARARAAEYEDKRRFADIAQPGGYHLNDAITMTGVESQTAALAPVAVAEQPAEPKKPRGRPRKTETPATAEAAPEIRANPENRVAPEEAESIMGDDVDDADSIEELPADDPQDTADEIAESAASAVSALTHDDVRQAMGDYAKRYGMPAAQADGKNFLGGAPNISSVAADKLAEVVATVRQAIKDNPFDRTVVAAA